MLGALVPGHCGHRPADTKAGLVGAGGSVRRRSRRIGVWLFGCGCCWRGCSWLGRAG